jgi:hypothetical protein
VNISQYYRQEGPWPPFKAYRNKGVKALWRKHKREQAEARNRLTKPERTAKYRRQAGR